MILKNFKTSQFHIFLILNPIFIKFFIVLFDFFSSFYWINLNQDWTYPLTHSLNVEGVEIHSLVVTLRITPCGVDPLQLGNGLNLVFWEWIPLLVWVWIPLQNEVIRNENGRVSFMYIQNALMPKPPRILFRKDNALGRPGIQECAL